MVHNSGKGTVGLIVDDKRHGSRHDMKKLIAELKEARQQIVEDSRRHAEKMEAKEMEWRAEIKNVL